MPMRVSRAAAGRPEWSAIHRTATITATAPRTSNNIVSALTGPFSLTGAADPVSRGRRWAQRPHSGRPAPGHGRHGVSDLRDTVRPPHGWRRSTHRRPREADVPLAPA